MQLLFKYRKFVVPAVFLSVFLSISVIVYKRMVAEGIEKAGSDLMLFRDLRQSKLASYFDTLSSEIVFWSANGEIRLLLEAMSEAWVALGDDVSNRLQEKYNSREVDGASPESDYDRLHSAIHSIFSRFQEVRGYYDIFLIDANGNIIYSVEKESDFATNIIDGPWRNTSFAKVVKSVIHKRKPSVVEFSDFSFYEPSNGQAALFVAASVSDIDGEFMGVLAFQIPKEAINKIMQVTTGMGETGETYIVGQDFLMRSQSRFSSEPSLLKVLVKTEAVTRALRGESGVLDAMEYRGSTLLSAYDSFSFDETVWAVIAEIDRSEVLQPVVQRFLYCVTGIFLLMVLISLLLFILYRWVVR